MEERARVAVAVQPRLLAEALARVLAAEDRDIIVLPEDGTPPSMNVRVAVTTGALPPEIVADVVVQVTDDPAREAGGVGRIERVVDLVALGCAIDAGFDARP